MSIRLEKRKPNTIIKSKQSEGDGSSEIPYKINKIKDSNLGIKLKNLNCVVIIEDCEFNGISIINCQNITIKNCNFQGISLIKCQNITIENCIFKEFNLLLSSINIRIKNNTFFKFNPYNCRELLLSNNSIDFSYKLDKNVTPNFYGDIIKIIVLFCIILVLFINMGFLLESIFTLTFIIIIIGVLFLLIFSIVYFVLRYSIFKIDLEEYFKNKNKLMAESELQKKTRYAG